MCSEAEYCVSVLACKTAQLLRTRLWSEVTRCVNAEGMQSCFVGRQQEALAVKHHGVDWVPFMHGTDSSVCRTGSFWVHNMEDGGLHTTRRHLHLDSLSTPGGCSGVQVSVMQV